MTRKIVILGAGRSSSTLIRYLLSKSDIEDLHIVVADISKDLALSKVKNHPRGSAINLNIEDIRDRNELLQNADLVISMLPASMHIAIAKDCVALGKNMVTASYVSSEMKAMEKEVKDSGLIFLNEVGLDPGIDHMSAMHVIDRIRDKGGKILLFESFAGGLLSPGSDRNLWNYKFSWNPRNVVIAGQGGAAKFIQEGTYKYIPYHRLFRRTEFLDVEGYGRFEAYANRDSLKYRQEYGLDDVLTLYRGTMRRVGFSRAWNMFVQMGMTDDSYIMEGSENMSYRSFVNSFLPYSPTDSVELKMRHYLKIDQDDVMWEKLLELDLFNPDKIVGIKDATPAQILQKILEESWTLSEGDQDMIVMYHKFGYELQGKRHQIDSKMVVTGDDATHTAMSKTVGLPLGISSLMVLNGKIKNKGVLIPTIKNIYDPILKELQQYGVIFREQQVPYMGYNPNNVAG